jgi:D-tyrosyl-tRNA(Tyr) deacylase
MRLVIQRVTGASVSVEEKEVSRIGPGLVVYVGIGRDDTPDDAEYCARKLLGLRLWESDKKWDVSVVDKGFEVLLVSQFTLHVTLKGHRPDFHLAMAADTAQPFFRAFVDMVARAMPRPGMVKEGVFGAYMQVATAVDGPVTICIDSRARS